MNAWKGFKNFIVDKKVKENNHIYSFYLKSEEEIEGGLPSYLPGQFIAIKVAKAGDGYSIPRQYTLSTTSNGLYYRVSVKREDEGHVSKLLCDEVQKGDIVQVSAPIGKFVLEEGREPVVLIGGGIGITPMLTMANVALQQNRLVHLMYSLPNSEYYAFDEEIKALHQQSTHIKSTVVYTRPTEKDKVERIYDIEGRLTKEYLRSQISLDAKVYLCGPVEFMRSMYKYLTDIGVLSDNIYYESFVPGQNISKPID